MKWREMHHPLTNSYSQSSLKQSSASTAANRSSSYRGQVFVTFAPNQGFITSVAGFLKEKGAS